MAYPEDIEVKTLKALEAALQQAVEERWDAAGFTNARYFFAENSFGYVENGKPVKVNVSIRPHTKSPGAAIHIEMEGGVQEQGEADRHLKGGPKPKFTTCDFMPLITRLAEKTGMTLISHRQKQIPNPALQDAPLGEQQFDGPAKGEMVYGGFSSTGTDDTRRITFMELADRESSLPLLLEKTRELINEQAAGRVRAALDIGPATEDSRVAKR